MAKVKVVGLPKAQFGTEIKDKETKQPSQPVLQPDNREDANVEIEKGEVVVSTDGVSNQKRTAVAGGKKHYEGGNPQKLANGSAVYSDHLKLEDPALLQVLGFNGKKPKTFAQIAKKWELSTLVDKREDDSIDQITKRSLDKSIEDSNFKLSLAFVLQQFHEKKSDEQVEHSRHFEPFLARTGMSYEQLFDAMGQEGESQLSDEPAKPGVGMQEAKLGYDLPMFNNGGETGRWGLDDSPYTPQEAYGVKGATQLNNILEELGIDQIAITDGKKDYRKEVKAKIKQVQARAAQNPAIVLDYMLNEDNNKTKSHRPNNLMQRALRNAGFKPADDKKGFSNKELQQLYKEGKIDDKFIVANFQDSLWHYRAPYTDIIDIEDEDEYNRLNKLVREEGMQASDGNWYIYKGEGKYEGYRFNKDGSIERIEPDAKIKNELYKWNTRPLDDSQDPINMDYRWENRRALAQARKNKRNIPYLRPIMPISETFYTDQAYYSPDQAIAAMQSESAAQQQQRAMFAGPQQQLANQMASNSMQMIGQVVSQYADKNVDAYNRERLFNTKVAQNAADKQAAAIQGHHNAVTTLKQGYANAYQNADNAVAAQEIAMHKERAQRKNLEASIGEQYVIDPDTGLHVFVKGKDFYPDTTPDKSVDDIYMDMMQRHPEMDPNIAAKLAMAKMSGKYNVQESDWPVNTQQYNS
jgi:hypothetical protein